MAVAKQSTAVPGCPAQPEVATGRHFIRRVTPRILLFFITIFLKLGGAILAGLALMPLFFAWRSLWNYFYYVDIILPAAILTDEHAREVPQVIR